MRDGSGPATSGTATCFCSLHGVTYIGVSLDELRWDQQMSASQGDTNLDAQSCHNNSCAILYPATNTCLINCRWDMCYKAAQALLQVGAMALSAAVSKGAMATLSVTAHTRLCLLIHFMYETATAVWNATLFFSAT